jgi:NADH-quinone oxidoreductase subunit J
MIDAALGDVDSALLVLLAFGALVGAALMIVLRQPMRVALALIGTMICLAAIYSLLGMHFIAAFQVLIYVGAVMLFMVYAIMLLDERDPGAARYSKLLLPGLFAFALLVGVLVASTWFSLPAPVGGLGDPAYPLSKFAAAFLNEYWLQFELTSILLVAVVVAALAVIRINRGARHG